MPAPYIIERRESLYLDLARTLAALAVLLDHAIPLFNLPWITDCGHQAVIVFFVLSGYVIANVAETRESAPRTFLVARLARLWSVLVPAIALTIVCDTLGRTFGSNLDSYKFSPIDHPLVRLGAALTFMSQSWVSIQPFSDYAAWSLSLEFWYYITFAAFFFLPPGRYRVIGVGIAILFCGHKGLLLLPVWLMGVSLQRCTRLRQFSGIVNTMFWLVGLLLLCWLGTPGMYWHARGITVGIIGPWLTNQLSEARAFWFDWILGFAFTLHLLGARTVTNWIPIERVARPIRWCAGISFACYLFHMPLLDLFAAFLPRDQGLLGIGLTIAVISLLGPPVERSKHWWRRKIEQFLNGRVFNSYLPWLQNHWVPASEK
jgi:peptidoglycan/LPS O-acetylase OafA/YrhL